MTAYLNKYEVLLTPVNWKYMSPEQDQIVALITVVDKLKDDNLKLSKSVKIPPKKKREEK